MLLMVFGGLVACAIAGRKTPAPAGSSDETGGVKLSGVGGSAAAAAASSGPVPGVNDSQRELTAEGTEEQFYSPHELRPCPDNQFGAAPMDGSFMVPKVILPGSESPRQQHQRASSGSGIIRPMPTASISDADLLARFNGTSATPRAINAVSGSKPHSPIIPSAKADAVVIDMPRTSSGRFKGSAIPASEWSPPHSDDDDDNDDSEPILVEVPAEGDVKVASPACTANDFADCHTAREERTPRLGGASLSLADMSLTAYDATPPVIGMRVALASTPESNDAM